MAMRKVLDCAAMPNNDGCTLRVSGTEDEVLSTGVQHAIRRHGHKEPPEQLRTMLRGVLRDE